VAIWRNKWPDLRYKWENGVTLKQVQSDLEWKKGGVKKALKRGLFF
jgi:hypothetical protein